MNLKRIITHLLYSQRQLRKAFPPDCLARIEARIRDAEVGHSGEIRFAVEAALEGPPLWRGQTARERAIDAFSQLRVWDTEHNNGILIYLLMADRDVEIVADRGIHRHTGDAVWEDICRDMETRLKSGDFEAAISTGIADIATHLTRHYPATNDRNEIPDAPTLL